MVCPKCGGKPRVLETVSRNNITYRYKKCNVCGHQFYTDETLSISDDARIEVTRVKSERSKKARYKERGIAYEPIVTGKADYAERKRKSNTRPLF